MKEMSPELQEAIRGVAGFIKSLKPTEIAVLAARTMMESEINRDTSSRSCELSTSWGASRTPLPNFGIWWRTMPTSWDQVEGA